MDILQLSSPLLGRDAALQDLGVTLFVKFSLNDGEGLSAARELSSLRLIHREHLTDVAIEVRDPLVRQGVGPYH
jgi:hypothetical protein